MTPPIHLPTDFLDALSRARSTRDVLEAATRWMPDVIAVERASMALPEGNDHLAVFALGDDATIFEQGTTLAIDDSLIGRAFRSQTVELEHDLSQSTAAEANYLVDAGLRSALVQPLVIGSRSLGTINLAHPEPDYFTEAHIQQLGSLASLFAAFLDAHEDAKRANTDTLTGCLSRSAILDELDAAFSRGDVSALYIDIDKFKMINDVHGHNIGDSVLRAVSARIQSQLSHLDILGRLGGDEFLVVTSRPSHHAAALADQIAEACSTRISTGTLDLQPDLSIGVANRGLATLTASDLLNDADQAMYLSKRRGVVVTIADDDSRTRSAMVATIDRDVDDALDTELVTLHLQPVRALHTNRLMGAEALVRWSHPQLGPVPAALLVERLELTGRTDRFTVWTLETACRLWREVRGGVPWLANVPLAINLTPRQLAWPGYLDHHLQTTESFGLHADDITVEVVESGEIQVGDATEQTLRSLSDHGVAIALDDFGVGYNALAYFARFPIHALKFDRSLVSIATASEDVQTILHGLTSLAHDLGASTIAEGIEFPEEAALCNELGVALGQGWHLGRPVSVASFIAEAMADGPPPTGHAAG